MGEGKKSNKKKKATQQTKSDVNGTPQANGASKKRTPSPSPEPETPLEKAEKQLEPELVPNPDSQTIANPVKNQSKKKKAKKRGFIARTISSILNLLTFKRIVMAYIIYVVYTCGDKNFQHTPLNEKICSNGISKYILENGLFKRYIESAVFSLKSNYIEPSISFVQKGYDEHGKTLVDSTIKTFNTNAQPLINSMQPHLSTIRSFYYENIHIPAILAWKDTNRLYNKHAKEHVDKIYARAQELYKDASVAAAPSLDWAQDRANKALKKAQDFNEKKIQPFYNNKVLPFVQKSWTSAVVFYDNKVHPTAQKVLVALNDTYTQQIKPVYQRHLEPQIIKIIEFIRHKLDPEGAKRKAREETERKAKIEADRKAKEEAEKKAKKEAERRAREKAEAERKAKAEAERKAKAEADRKAKAEAERKAKAEAERKAKAEAAEFAAVEAATIALNQAAAKRISRFQEYIVDSIGKYTSNVEKTKKATLEKAEDQIDAMKKSALEYVKNLEQLVENLKQDTQKNITEKRDTAILYAKKVLEQLKEKSKETLKDAEVSSELIKVEIENQINELETTLNQHVTDAKADVQKSISEHTKADKTKLQDFDKKIDDFFSENLASVMTGSAIIEETIIYFTKTIHTIAKDLAQDVIETKNAAIEAFEKQHIELAEAMLKQKEEKSKSSRTPVSGDSQGSVEVKPPTQKSRDVVLELLRTRRYQRNDPVLAKLKIQYQKLVEERKSIHKRKYPDDDGGEDYEDYYDEVDNCDVMPGECSG